MLLSPLSELVLITHSCFPVEVFFQIVTTHGSFLHHYILFNSSLNMTNTFPFFPLLKFKMKNIYLILALCHLALSQTTCPWWSRLWCTPEAAPEPPAPDPLTVLWGTNYGKLGMSLQCANGVMSIFHGVSVFSVFFFFSVIMAHVTGFHAGAFLFSVPMVSSEVYYMYESIKGMLTYCKAIWIARYGSA